MVTGSVKFKGSNTLKVWDKIFRFLLALESTLQVAKLIEPYLHCTYNQTLFPLHIYALLAVYQLPFGLSIKLN